MTHATAAPLPSTTAGLEPEIVAVLPAQGEWSEADYLWLTNRTNRLIEYTEGRLEPLPTPTDKHQAILDFVFVRLRDWLERLGGRARTAGIRVRIGPGRFRQPDITVLLDAHDPRRQDDYWRGADLVVEVVSPDGPERDHVQKRQEYAAAGIPEYWIVDPKGGAVTVMRLDGTDYVEQGVFNRGAVATSAILTGFGLPVDDILDAD